MAPIISGSSQGYLTCTGWSKNYSHPKAAATTFLPALPDQCPLLSKLHDSTSGFHCLMIPIPRECQCLQGCCPFHMPNVLLPHAAKCYILRRNWENVSGVTMSCFVSWWTYTIFPDSTSQCPSEKIAWRANAQYSEYRDLMHSTVNIENIVL